MNKLNAIILLGLVVFASACFVLAESDSLTSEIEEDEDTGIDGGANGKTGIRDVWGRNDVIQDGIGDYVDAKKAECPKRKSSEECRTCCNNLGKAFAYAPLKRDGFRLGKCTCFAKAGMN